MSIKDLNSSLSQSLRLEEFSTFNSCIKCFRKPIISPLLTSERREEASRYRTAATKIQEEREKKKFLWSSDEVKVLQWTDQNHLATSRKSDFAKHIECENLNSALIPTSVIDVQACPTNNARNFSNEMHISTCKITTSNISSTVHKDVIIFPGNIQANNDTEYLSKSNIVNPNCYSDQNLALDNVDLSDEGNKEKVLSASSSIPCISASKINEEYLSKNGTSSSSFFYKEHKEAHLRQCNVNLGEINNQQIMIDSKPTMPYIINTAEPISESDVECSQDPLLLENINLCESNEQNLNSMSVLSFCSTTNEMPNDSSENFINKNLESPYVEDEVQVSLDKTYSCIDISGQILSSLTSPMPYSNGSNSQMPYENDPTVEVLNRNIQVEEISTKMGPTLKVTRESSVNQEQSLKSGTDVVIPNEIVPRVNMLYENSPTMEVAHGSRASEEKPSKIRPKESYESGSNMEVTCKSQPSIELHKQSGSMAKMPQESNTTEEMASVSEDEQDSNTESLEFGSLPTVISAGQFVLPQDTDNESSVTCLTQSTDLEKYLDTSIEYSSPDDARSLSSRSQMNMSARSDDASSETLVNTGSENTPCASAMALRNSDAVDHFPENFVSDAAGSKRANSVDSFLLKTLPKELFIRKSQSEPSYPETKQSELRALDSKNAGGDSNLISESEVFETFEDVKKALKRKLVRSNSYTLEHPSPALIMAHAGCNCSQDLNNISPHSCSSEKLNFPTPNRAFKKEKVNINLPSMQDRKKFFPILGSTNVIVSKTDSNAIKNTESSNICDQPEVMVLEANNDSQVNEIEQVENLRLEEQEVQNLTNNCNENQFEAPVENNTFEPGNQSLSPQQNEALYTSPENKSEDKNNNINEVVNQVIRDMKDLQKSRVSQFFEEQNKLWLQMQEEFKEQERLLCEKLNAINILQSADGALSIHHHTEMNGTEYPLINSFNKVSTNSIANTNGTDNGSSSKTSPEEPLEKEFLENSHFKSITTNSSSNLQNTNPPTKYTHNTHSTISSTSETNTLEKSGSKPLPPKQSSLPVFNDSQPVDYCDGSVSVQSDISSTSLNTQSRELSSDYPEDIHSKVSSNFFRTSSQDLLSYENPETLYYRMTPKSSNTQKLPSDKQENINSEISPKLSSTSRPSNENSETICSGNSDVQSQNLSSDYPETIHSRISSKSFNSENLLSDNQGTFLSEVSSKSSKTYNLPSDKPEPIHSVTSITSIDADSETSVETMQSLYNNCPISQMNMPESSYSSLSFRSISSLSQTSDVAKMFRDFRFAGENICSENCSCSKCSKSFARRLYFDNLSDDGNKFFTTPISPSEFIPSPAVFQQQKSLTSTTLLARQFQSPDIVATNVQNNNSVDFGLLDLNSSETNSELPNKNLNRVPVVSTHDDKSYSEEEIRAINEMVQSSYASSYLKKDQNKALVHSNNLNKNHIHEQIIKALVPDNSNINYSHEQGSFDVLSENISTIEQGAFKQNISSSLTNLKRRQSRDILKDPVLLQKFEKLPALVKGYLTRRLFKSERVQDLIRTLKDTALLVGKCSQELNLKGNSVSERDVEFHRQLIAQLMRTFDNVYDIFCTMSVGEQMKIIAESRNFRLKKNKAAKKENAIDEIAEKCRSSPSKKPKLSSATVKALERKRSSIHSRTYLVEDMKRNKISRGTSKSSTKSHGPSKSLSPYKPTVGTPLKRKTTSVCKPSWK